MPGTAVVDSGNYDLQIATGFIQDGFTLDDPIKGILAGYTTTTTRTNLLPNPNMDNASVATYYQAINITETRSTDYSYSGTYSLKGVIDVGTVAQYFQVLQTAGAMIDVVAGQTYTFSSYIYLPSSNTADSTWRAELYFWNGTSYTGANAGTTTTITRGNWTRLTTTATVPAGYYKALPRITKPAPALAVGQIAYVDAWLLETGSNLLPYFDGTYAEPYTGYTLTEQAWNGTANASTSTATWGLTSSYINSNFVLDGTTEFASVMDSVTRITAKRGRRDIGDTFSAGTMTFTIQDVDGIFNPFDENSPYYDTAQSKPGLAPMREVKLIRYSSTNVPELLMSAYVVNYDYNFALGGLDTVTVYCADQFYLLAQTYLNEYNVSAQTSGERITSVLNLPEVDFPAGARSIATGTVNLGHDAAYTVPAGTNVLQYIAQINDTAEFGRLFMSRDGVLTFQNRIGNTLSASVADFHDDGTNFKYNGVGITFEADAVVNRAVVTALDGKTATATDAGSIATYFIQTNSITNSLLHEQPSIDAAAAYLLNPEPEARYTSVETAFLMLTTAQKDTLATVDIGDTISVEKTFPSGTGTTQLAQELSVEGIEHRLDFSTGHSVLYSTAPTTIVYELILDDAVYGTIDTTNVLG
jgi:hypothetical protein